MLVGMLFGIIVNPGPLGVVIVTGVEALMTFELLELDMANGVTPLWKSGILKIWAHDARSCGDTTSNAGRGHMIAKGRWIREERTSQARNGKLHAI